MLRNMTEELPWKYGQMLTSAIEGSGMTRRAVARQARLSAPTIINLETGYRSVGPGMRVRMNPTAKTVVKIAMVLNMSLRKSLEAAGLGDEIPEGASDEELQARFKPIISEWLHSVTTAELLEEVKRRMEEEPIEDGE